MNLKEYGENLKEKIKKISEDRQKNALVVGSDMVALIVDRIINHGKNADNVLFPPYTQRFKELRKLAGLRYDIRMHWWTGDMLKSVEARIKEHDDYKTVVEIAPKDAYNQKIINKDSENMGISLLKLTDDERQIIKETNDERLKKILKSK